MDSTDQGKKMSVPLFNPWVHSASTTSSSEVLFQRVWKGMDRQDWIIGQTFYHPAYRRIDGIISPVGALIPKCRYRLYFEKLPIYSSNFTEVHNFYTKAFVSILEDLEDIFYIAKDISEMKSLFKGIALINGLSIEQVGEKENEN